MRPPAVRRGYTVLEMMTVLAIIGVLAALTLNGLDGLRTRSNFTSSTGELVAAIHRTRAEAFSRGAPTAFVVDTAADGGARYWGVRDVTQPAATFLDTFTPGNVTNVITKGTLGGGVSFGPSTGYGQTLTVPFASIPATPSAAGSQPVACTFCRTSGTNANFGVIVFDPGGRVNFSVTPPVGQFGHQLTLTGTQNGIQRIRLVAIISGTGAIEVFEKN